MREGNGMDRRGFLAAAAGAALAAAGCATGTAGAAGAAAEADLEAFLLRKMAEDHIPGLSGRVVRDGRVAWSGAYGWSDIERRVPMGPDRLQNIASISKTFTTTALMQLWEEGGFRLDDDVNGHLPFRVRNPRHPERPITFRHLLTHVSSIRDGSAYARGYACRDPDVALGEWIGEYLTPGGRFHDAAENWHEWAPGERWEYNNIAYGLLGHLAERISGASLPELCRERIFEPLGMGSTSWSLGRIDRARHSVPYTWVGDGTPRGPSWGGQALGVIHEPGTPVPPVVGNGYRANCLYNHPNYPDGFLRTSVDELTRYLRAYLGGGELEGRRILRPETIRTMLTPQPTGSGNGRQAQGLTWYSIGRVRGQEAWGHGGSDPGVNTDLRLLPEEGSGAIVFFNTNGAGPQEVTLRLLETRGG